MRAPGRERWPSSARRTVTGMLSVELVRKEPEQVLPGTSQSCADWPQGASRLATPHLSFLFLAPCLKVSLPLVWTLPYFWAPCSDIVQSLGSRVDDLPPSWPRASQGTCRKTVEPRAELPGCPVPG